MRGNVPLLLYLCRCIADQGKPSVEGEVPLSGVQLEMADVRIKTWVYGLPHVTAPLSTETQIYSATSLCIVRILQGNASELTHYKKSVLERKITTSITPLQLKVISQICG
jgi:hypothetical protein